MNITIYLKFRQFFKIAFLFTVPNYLQGIYRLQYKVLWLIFFFNKNTSTYIHKTNLISLPSIHLEQLRSYINSTEENSERASPKYLDEWMVCASSQEDHFTWITRMLINTLGYIIFKNSASILYIHKSYREKRV